MKKIILFILIFVFGFLFFALSSKPALANPNCITFHVTVKASDWPGGHVQVGCPGDGGKVCTGQVVTLRPGQKEVTLGKCSCYPNENGCLKVATKVKIDTSKAHGKRKVIVVQPLPSKCTITKKTNSCGSNGQTKNSKFKITCTPKHVTITPTFTPTPTLKQCIGPKPVVNVKVTCPTCDGDVFVTPTPTSEITPTPTPFVSGILTPTPTPKITKTPTPTPILCGGIANKQCPSGMSCQIANRNIPDASGVCVAGSGGGHQP